MPARPAKICTYSGCVVLVSDGTSRCLKHPKKPWAKRVDATPRRTGEWLTKERRRLFSKQPLCVMCLDKDPQVVTLATIRDHIIPLEEGGPDDAMNTQPLCVACHKVKTEAEIARGVARRK